MIVTAVLTLTLLAAQPDALVQVFSPTQGVTITAPARDGCSQVDAWWVQCWGESAKGQMFMVRYRCGDPFAVLVVRVDQHASLFEMRCLFRLFSPFVSHGDFHATHHQ
jgi:hypothetical protein